MARTSNYALHLLTSVKAVAERSLQPKARRSTNISVAIAEKLAALQTARFFQEQERTARADLTAFDRL